MGVILSKNDNIINVKVKFSESESKVVLNNIVRRIERVIYP